MRISKPETQLISIFGGSSGCREYPRIRIQAFGVQDEGVKVPKYGGDSTRLLWNIGESTSFALSGFWNRYIEACH
jgi:hypothetical protein